jgi:hypothetical protein
MPYFVAIWENMFDKSFSSYQQIKQIIENEKLIKSFELNYKINIKYSKVQKKYVIGLYNFKKQNNAEYVLFKNAKTLNGFFVYFKNKKTIYQYSLKRVNWKELGFLQSEKQAGFPYIEKEWIFLFERYMNSILKNDEIYIKKEEKEILKLKECASYFFKENKESKESKISYGLKVKNIIYYLILKNNGIDFKDLNYEREFNLDKLSYLFTKEELDYLIKYSKKEENVFVKNSNDNKEELINLNEASLFLNGDKCFKKKEILYKDILNCYYKEEDKNNIKYKNKELNLFLEKINDKDNKSKSLIIFKEINSQLNKYLGKSLGIKKNLTNKENKRIELLNKYIYKEISNIYVKMNNMFENGIINLYSSGEEKLSNNRIKVHKKEDDKSIEAKRLVKNNKKIEYIIKNFIIDFVKHINNQKKVTGYAKDKNSLEMEKQLFLNLYSSCVYIDFKKENYETKQEYVLSFFGNDIQEIEDINKMIFKDINISIFKIVENVFPKMKNIEFSNYIEHYPKLIEGKDKNSNDGNELFKYVYKSINKKITEYVYELMYEFKHNVNGITGYSLIEYVHSIVSYINDSLVLKKIDLIIEEDELEYYKNKNEELNKLCVINNKTTTKEWLVRLPNSNIELTEWGNKLNNCVGSYFNSDSIIYGVFYDNELKYCIEEKPNGNVTQFRGLNNKNFPNKNNIEIEMVEKISKVFQLNIKENGLNNIYYMEDEELSEDVLINKIRRQKYIDIENNEVLKYALEKKQNRKYIYDEFKELEFINSDVFDNWIDKGIRNKKEIDIKLKYIYDFVEQKITINKLNLENNLERQIVTRMDKMEIEDIVNGKVVKKTIKVRKNVFIDLDL